VLETIFYFCVGVTMISIAAMVAFTCLALGVEAIKMMLGH